jgi:UDP-N-acetylmuramyl pentapeptide phosphotransferase/UDP-N-acetylglucosamine-1-phosphate transferase
LAIGLGLLATVAVLSATASFFGFQNPTMILLAFSAGMSAVTWWDARRIGARRIRGHPRFEAAPWNWAFGSFLLGYALIPWYLLNRQRIRRDAVPVDWEAILQAMQTEASHGDNLSITHPPSPR